MERLNRSNTLDSIRTVAILAVLIYHVGTRYDITTLDPVAYLFRRYGLLGVDIFFPLSGYLITKFLIYNHSTADIKVFFQRRFFRIVPLYFLAVTIFVFISAALDHESGNIGRIWITYLFLTGWFIFFEGNDVVPYTITWSLSVEEFAYILFGIAAWLIRRHLFMFMIVISVMAISLRLYLNLSGYLSVYNFPPARLDSIAIGGLVCILYQYQRHGALMLVLASLSALTYVLAIIMPDLWSSLKYTFIAFGTCFAIVLFESRFRNVNSRFVASFASIGFYSYFTYLFHLFNIEFLLLVWSKGISASMPPFWGVVLLAFLMTHAQAVISFKVFEKPLMDYGRRHERRRQAS